MTRPLLTRPDSLTGDQKALLSQLTSACAEMTSLASLIRSFAALLKPSPGNQARLTDWTQTARTCELPNLHAFTRGLDLAAAATLPTTTAAPKLVVLSLRVVGGFQPAVVTPLSKSANHFMRFV